MINMKIKKRSLRRHNVPFLVKQDGEELHLVNKIAFCKIKTYYELYPILTFFSSGMVVACLVKEIQICTELRKMAEMGLIQSEVVRKR